MICRVELPVLPSAPSCPAAVTISGVCPSQQGVVCAIMRQDHEEDPGLNMTAAATGFIHHQATGGVYLNLKSDPATVTQFCHGTALPVVTDEDHEGGRASHTYCPVWQAEKHRLWEARHNLLDEPEPEAVSAGVTVSSLEDPVAAAREVQSWR